MENKTYVTTLEDVVVRAKRVLERYRLYDRVAASAYAILDSVEVNENAPIQIPIDEYSSGNRDDQCWAKVYGRTKKQAEHKKDSYFSLYPTFGYNTRVTQEGWSNGYYYIFMDRWHSCD